MIAKSLLISLSLAIVSLAAQAQPSAPDECDTLLSYEPEQRMDAFLTLITNETETRKATMALLTEYGCQGKLPDFSRSEANRDAGRFLPYLERKYGRSQ